MVTLRLPPLLERKLAREAKKRGRTKTALAQDAVIGLLQDFEDVREADAVVEGKHGVRGQAWGQVANLSLVATEQASR